MQGPPTEGAMELLLLFSSVEKAQSVVTKFNNFGRDYKILEGHSSQLM